MATGQNLGTKKTKATKIVCRELHFGGRIILNRTHTCTHVYTYVCIDIHIYIYYTNLQNVDIHKKVISAKKEHHLNQTSIFDILIFQGVTTKSFNPEFLG